MRAALAGLTGDRRLQALRIAWFLALFMEGAAGFGTPVALAAQLPSVDSVLESFPRSLATAIISDFPS